MIRKDYEAILVVSLGILIFGLGMAAVIQLSKLGPRLPREIVESAKK